MWVPIIVGIMAILSGMYAFMRFTIKAIMREIGPEANGSSLKGQVTRLERQMERLELRLDAVLLKE